MRRNKSPINIIKFTLFSLFEHNNIRKTFLQTKSRKKNDPFILSKVFPKYSFLGFVPVFIPSCFKHISEMDFLPLGDVRSDPIINPTCLSDHVHTFYGAASIRPETSYEDLRATTANSGNVKENKSLYWHPTVYNYESSSGIFQKDDIYFASAYYIWETGKAKAFPNGFKMIAGFDDDNTRAFAECVDPSPCEKDDCSTNNDFFPTTACAELEVSMAFPTCWDGENIDSDDHRSHVSYDIDGGEFGSGKSKNVFQIHISLYSIFMGSQIRI